MPGTGLTICLAFLAHVVLHPTCEVDTIVASFWQISLSRCDCDDLSYSPVRFYSVTLPLPPPGCGT